MKIRLTCVISVQTIKEIVEQNAAHVIRLNPKRSTFKQKNKKKKPKICSKFM